jgi:hypothetical protein
VRVALADPAEWDKLLDSAAYEKHVAAES